MALPVDDPRLQFLYPQWAQGLAAWADNQDGSHCASQLLRSRLYGNTRAYQDAMEVDASSSFMHCQSVIPIRPPLHHQHHARGISPNVDIIPTNTGYILAAHVCLERSIGWTGWGNQWQQFPINLPAVLQVLWWGHYFKGTVEPTHQLLAMSKVATRQFATKYPATLCQTLPGSSDQTSRFQH